jgi:hypothetical protein
LGVVVADGALGGFYVCNGLAAAVVVAVLRNFLKDQTCGGAVAALGWRVADVLLLVGQLVAAEGGEQRRSLRSRGVVAARTLGDCAGLGSTQKDVGGSIRPVIIGSGVLVGRFGDDGVGLPHGRSQRHKFRSSIASDLGVALRIHLGIGRVPALEIGIEVHGCYYY